MSDPIQPHTADEAAPIDAEFEPAPRKQQPSDQNNGPGWRAFLALAAVSAVSLILAALSAGLIPGFKTGAADIAAIKQDLAGLQSDRDTARTQTNSLSSKVDTSQTDQRAISTAIEALEAQAETMNTALRSFEREMTALRAEISAAEQFGLGVRSVDPETGDPIIAAVDPDLLGRVSALEQVLTRFPNADTQDPTETADLTDQIADLRAQIASLQMRPDTPGPGQTADSFAPSADAALALSSIEAAARRGRPFQSGYQRLLTAMPGETAVTALGPLALNGAPTLADLREQYPSLYQSALDAEAVAAGGAAGWMRNLFGDSLTVRKAGEESVVDILDTAQTALEQGDLAAAIVQIETLAPNVQSVFTDWLDNARNRQSLEDALQALRLIMIAKDRP